MQNVSDEILKRYFPGLVWKIHGEGEASANIPTRENERFIDPSISVYRHSDGEYSASLYLADDLQVANWIDSVTLEGALESLRDRMLGISIALQTALTDSRPNTESKEVNHDCRNRSTNPAETTDL